MIRLGEVLSITTYDGQILEFRERGPYLLSYGNFGAPPIRYITRKGYKQHGETVLDYTILPRQFTVQLYHPGPENDGDRDGYWALRQELHDFLRPNRGGPLQFNIVTQGRVYRAITARADPGLVMPPSSANRNDWSIDEPIDFTSYDPFWFDPTGSGGVITGTTSEDLVFPITFPIVFGFEGVLYAETIVYAGTWRSYPKITLTGPYTQAVLEQVTTGAIIQLTVPINQGETRVLNLDPFDRYLVDGSGVSQWGDLGPADLVNWYLAEDPIASGGSNEIDIKLYDGTLGVSDVSLIYNERYYAL